MIWENAFKYTIIEVMKPLILFTIGIILIRCSAPKSTESQNDSISPTVMQIPKDYERPKDIIDWKSDNDTLTYDKWVITFSKADSVNFPDYFLEQNVFDSAYNKKHNYFQGVQALEHYLLSTDQNYFQINDSLELKLSNGLVKRFNRWNGDYGYNFMAKLKDLDFYLLHVQFYEGSDNLLVNIKDGTTTSMTDLPYFNPNRTMIASPSADIFRTIDDNGIEILIHEGPTVFKRKFFIDTGGWSPEQCLWVSNNELVVKRKFFQFNEVPKELWDKTNYVKITFHDVE
jgi:hypothetical protein